MPILPAAVDMAGHDADLALVGGDDARAVGPDQPGRRCPASARFTRTMSSTGMPSVMQTTSGDPGIDRLQDRVGGEGRRHVDGAGSRAGLRDRLGHRVEDRQVEMRACRPCRA